MQADTKGYLEVQSLFNSIRANQCNPRIKHQIIYFYRFRLSFARVWHSSTAIRQLNKQDSRGLSNTHEFLWTLPLIDGAICFAAVRIIVYEIVFSFSFNSATSMGISVFI